jgi:16S rRNA processing protein RimM
MYEYLQIGEIVNTHGIKGEVKIIPLTDSQERFDELDWVYIDRNGSLDKLKIESIKHIKNSVILKLKDIDTVEAAEAMKGLFLVVDRKNAVKLPIHSYFVCDILGSEVQDMTGTSYGKLTEVLHTGSNDVYVVKNVDGRELLLPALKSVIKEVSVEAGVIKVVIPEGLLEDEV